MQLQYELGFNYSASAISVENEANAINEFITNANTTDAAEYCPDPNDVFWLRNGFRIKDYGVKGSLDLLMLLNSYKDRNEIHTYRLSSVGHSKAVALDGKYITYFDSNYYLKRFSWEEGINQILLMTEFQRISKPPFYVTEIMY